MTTPRRYGLLALSLLEAPGEEKEKALQTLLAEIASNPRERERYLQRVESEAFRLSAKRTPEERRAEARRARGFAEQLLHRVGTEVSDDSRADAA